MTKREAKKFALWRASVILEAAAGDPVSAFYDPDLLADDKEADAIDRAAMEVVDELARRSGGPQSLRQIRRARKRAP